MYGCNKDESDCPALNNCPYKCACNEGTQKYNGRCAYFVKSTRCIDYFTTPGEESKKHNLTISLFFLKY